MHKYVYKQTSLLAAAVAAATTTSGSFQRHSVNTELGKIPCYDKMKLMQSMGRSD